MLPRVVVQVAPADEPDFTLVPDAVQHQLHVQLLHTVAVRPDERAQEACVLVEHVGELGAVRRLGGDQRDAVARDAVGLREHVHHRRVPIGGEQVERPDVASLEGELEQPSGLSVLVGGQVVVGDAPEERVVIEHRVAPSLGVAGYRQRVGCAVLGIVLGDHQPGGVVTEPRRTECVQPPIADGPYWHVERTLQVVVVSVITATQTARHAGSHEQQHERRAGEQATL